MTEGYKDELSNMGIEASVARSELESLVKHGVDWVNAAYKRGMDLKKSVSNKESARRPRFRQRSRNSEG